MWAGKTPLSSVGWDAASCRDRPGENLMNVGQQCPCGKDDQLHPGLYEQVCSQWVQGSD